MLKDPKAIGSIEKITPSDKKKDLRDKMSEAKRVVHSDRPDSLASVRVIKPKDPKKKVDEISKDTLASYTKKATMSAASGADRMARAAPGDKAAAMAAIKAKPGN